MTGAEAKVPTRRRWLRRCGWLLALVLLARIVLGFAVEPIARSVAAGFGIDLRWERIDLSLLSGRVEIWQLEAGVAVEGSDDSRRLVEARTIALDVDVSALFGGALRVRRLELDGVRADLSRNIEGEWNLAPLLAQFAGGDDGSSEPEPEPDVSDELRPIVLDAPFQIMVARAQDISLRLRDASVEPAVDVAITSSFTATDIGMPGREIRIDFQATSPECLDLLRVRGSGKAEGSNADLRLDLKLSRLQLKPLATFLAPLGLEPICDRIDGRARLTAVAAPATELGDRLSVSVEIEGAHLSHDGVEALALDTFTADVAELWSRGIAVRQITVAGARAGAERLPDGGFALAGLALRPRPASAERSEQADEVAESEQADEVASTERTADRGAAVPSTPFAWSIESVQVTGGKIAFDDRGILPTAAVAAELEELTFGPVSSSVEAPASNVALSFRLPGMIERGELTGTIESLAPDPEVAAALDVIGIDPQNVAPYLAMLGIEPAFAAGTLRVDEISLGTDSDGDLEFGLTGLAVRDGEQELAAIDRGTLSLPTGTAPVIALSGVRAEVVRASDDTVVALGLRYGGAPVKPTSAAQPQVEQAAQTQVEPAGQQRPSAQFRVPVVALPRIDLQFESLLLTDDSNPLAQVRLGPIEVSVAPDAEAPPEMRAYDLAADGRIRIARDFATTVRLEQSSSGRLEVRGSATARGIDLSPVQSWLELLGVEPTLTDGSFDGAFDVAVESVDGRPSIDATLGPILLTDATDGEPRRWLELERIGVDSLVLGNDTQPGALSIERIEIRAPRVALERDAGGGLVALGLRVPPPKPAVQGDESAEAPDVASPEAPAGSTPVAEVAEPASAPLRAGSIQIGRIELTDARAFVDDLGLAAPHSFVLGGGATVENLAPGAGATAASIEAAFDLDSSTLQVSGEVVLDPTDLRTSLVLRGEHLAGDALAPYLPPAVTVALADGVAAARLTARVAAAQDGGQSVTLDVEEIDLREAGAERPLVALTALRVDAPRIDPAGNAFEVQNVSVEGLILDVVRTADGGVASGGVRFARPPAGEIEATESAPPVKGESTNASAVGAGTSSAPRVRIDRLDFEVAELRVSSEAFPEASPSVIATRLSLREPYALDIDPDDEEDRTTGMGLDVALSVMPGGESLEASLDLALFAERPRVDAKLALRGLSADGLLRLAPELAGRVEPAGLEDGTFDASFAAQLDWRRRGPLDFDLSNGFGAELELRDVALRAEPGAEIALGVDLIDLTAKRIAPRTRFVHLSRLEIEMPHARVRKTVDGLEVAGLLIRTDGPDPAAPQAPAEPAPDAATAGAGGAESTPSEAPVQEAPTLDPTAVEAVAEAGTDERRAEGMAPPRSVGELRLDELLVNDIDVLLVDASADPELAVPIELFGLEVRGLTTRARTQSIPIRFSATVGAGNVSLPARHKRSSLLRGVAHGVANAVVGSSEEISYEERPLFQEFNATGRLVLVPAPSGWIRASLSGFELLGLRGLARQSGVEIGDGVLDFNARVRLSGAQGGRVDSVSSFAYLKLSEPAGGPISRFLKLPAPLDSVLFVLKNEQGEHRIPLGFNFGDGGEMSTAEISARASAAFLGLVTEALASAPMRAVGSVTDVVGLGGLIGGGDRKPKYAGLTATIHFAPGGAHVGPEERAVLADLIKAMRKDPLLELDGLHAFSPSDLKQAEQLASPESGAAALMLRSLRGRRAELTRRRGELSAAARTHLLLGASERFESIRVDLIEVDRDLGEAEAAIDRIAVLLRPGAQKRRDRRTRQAAMDIAGARVDAIRRAMLRAGVPYERVSIRPPRYELPGDGGEGDPAGRIDLVTKGGTPPKGFFRRILGWIGL